MDTANLTDAMRVKAKHEREVQLSSWLWRRDVVNHDWLMNRFQVFLRAHRDELDSATTLEPHLQDRLSEWSKKLPELRALAADAPDALSPVQLFDQPPLDRLPKAQRSWFQPTIERLYRASPSLGDKLSVVEEKIRQVDRRVSELSLGSDQGGAGTRLYRACSELSGAISALPAQVQLP
jgi:hypothetical protein